ncbi:hypothetical protein B7R25_10570 [Subtercola boreus]|uniref:Uncharacterized protein n=2 Tax=Subtercola boreus TaxID=120213 RepID=A0A3E0W8X5_9MICO|nr:hypothetical protein B7R24_10505 [Subtercola boreus]RFA20136.1 hypothetical protein B7R23_10445 [Subtercola boreus]RFA26463.1 hypothetical protein B7R25_10570 [Subtercola boreus]
MLQHPVSPRPFAIIRLIRFPAQKGTVAAWYRIVTWAETSADRELVGWCLSHRAASEAAWDFFRAQSSWQHAQAASRMHERPGGVPPRPPAHELLLAYRAALREAALRDAALHEAALHEAALRGTAEAPRAREPREGALVLR